MNASRNLLYVVACLVIIIGSVSAKEPGDTPSSSSKIPSVFLPAVAGGSEQKHEGSVTTETGTKLILLGSGTPRPEPDHSGCSLAVVVNNTPYIIDFGPGLIRLSGSDSYTMGNGTRRTIAGVWPGGNRGDDG